MGFWNDGISQERERSRSRSTSPSRRKHSSSHRSHNDGPYSRPTAARSTSSFISSLTGYDVDSARASRADQRPRERRANSTYGQSRGFFSNFGVGGGSSNYGYGSSGYGHSGRARPRSGFVAKIRKWLRDLYNYMKKHPLKVFMLVIMPLITGGALTKILSVVGIRLPPSVERFVGSSMGRGVGQGERLYARNGARDFAGGSALGGMMGAGLGGSLGGLMSMAKMFVLDEEDEILRDVGYHGQEREQTRTPMAYEERPRSLSRTQRQSQSQSQNDDRRRRKDHEENEESGESSHRIKLEDAELSDAQVWRDE